MGVLCFSRPDLRAARTRFGLTGLVDVHHVIPRSCARHEALGRLGFSVEDASNFAFVPNRTGRAALRLHPGRVIHSSHLRYNRFVWSELDAVRDDADLLQLLAYLHVQVRAHHPTIPWD